MANAVLFVCGPAGSLTARPRLSARRAPRVQRDRERERERERARARSRVRERGWDGGRARLQISSRLLSKAQPQQLPLLDSP